MAPPTRPSERTVEVGGLDILFLGNPGAGKSTLLSEISGLIFESGLSWGSGYTTKFQFQESKEDPRVRFGDTPGLADVKMAEQAAEAITAALRDSCNERRQLKIFFVITTEDGRLRPDDFVTIKKVMESIKAADGSMPGPHSYSVIVNKCNFLDQPTFREKGQAKLENMFCAKSSVVPFNTSSIFFIPFVPQLGECDAPKQTRRTSPTSEGQHAPTSSLLVWISSFVRNFFGRGFTATLRFPGLAEFVWKSPALPPIGEAKKIDASHLEERIAWLEEFNRVREEQHRKQLQEIRKENEMARLEFEQRCLREYLDLKKKLTEGQRQVLEEMSAKLERQAAQAGQGSNWKWQILLMVAQCCIAGRAFPNLPGLPALPVLSKL